MVLQSIKNLTKRLQRQRKQRRALKKWLANGQPNPPPHLIKQANLTDHAKQYGLEVLVETGTYHGDMLDAMRHQFRRLYSIELSERYFIESSRRFEGQAHIKVLHGDSGERLGELVKSITQPALFWLDGHYSAGKTARGMEDTPVLRELEHIFSSHIPRYVILIDDARCFGTNPGYPTLETIETFVKKRRPDAVITVQHDCICITPPEEKGTPAS